MVPATTTRSSRGDLAWCLLAGLLLVAGVALRVSGLRWMQFDREQEEILLRAAEAQRTFGACHGIKASNGILMPPFFVDLIALVLLVVRDPVRIAAFVAAANLAGLACFHVLVRRLFGVRIALWTSVLLVSMPWAVLYSRRIWAPDLQFPLVSVFLLLLFSGLEDYRRWKTVLAFAVFGLLCEIHPSAWFLLPPLAVFVVRHRIRVPPADALLGVLAVGVLYLRWLLHEIGAGFDDVVWYLHAPRASVEAGPGPLVRNALATGLWVIRSTSGAGFEDFDKHLGSPEGVLPGAPLLATIPMRIAMAWTAGAILFAAGLFAAGLFGARLLRRQDPRTISAGDRALDLCVLVVLLVPGAYVLVGAVPFAHYVAILHPFLALLCVAGLARAVPAWTRPAVAGLALANCVFLARFEAGIAADPGSLDGRYGIPYAAREDEWRRRLDEGYDEIASDHARRRAEDAATGRLFEASREVLFRLSTTDRSTPIETRGGIATTVAGGVLRVVGGGPKSLVGFPANDPPAGKASLVRIDVTSPWESTLACLHRTKGDDGLSYKKMQILLLPEGRSVHYVRIQDPDVTGPIWLRLGTYRLTVHALEIRAVDAPDLRR